jgi:hypothetical protein
MNEKDPERITLEVSLSEFNTITRALSYTANQMCDVGANKLVPQEARMIIHSGGLVMRQLEVDLVKQLRNKTRRLHPDGRRTG